METRRDLLIPLQTEDDLREEEIKSLKKRVQDGMAYLSLKNNYGWKKLVEEYITPNSSENKFLMAKKEELSDVQVTIKELKNLLNFVESKIQLGTKALETLQRHKID